MLWREGNGSVENVHNSGGTKNLLNNARDSRRPHSALRQCEGGEVSLPEVKLKLRASVHMV